MTVEWCIENEIETGLEGKSNFDMQKAKKNLHHMFFTRLWLILQGVATPLSVEFFQ